MLYRNLILPKHQPMQNGFINGKRTSNIHFATKVKKYFQATYLKCHLVIRLEQRSPFLKTKINVDLLI